MKTNFDEMIKGMTEFLKYEAKTETILGNEFKLGSFNCVPIMAIGMGIGGGDGVGKSSKNTEAGGGIGGAGLGLAPIGFLVSNKDTIKFITVQSPSIMNTVVEKLPDLLSKYFESQKNGKLQTA